MSHVSRLPSFSLSLRVLTSLCLHLMFIYYTPSSLVITPHHIVFLHPPPPPPKVPFAHFPFSALPVSALPVSRSHHVQRPRSTFSSSQNRHLYSVSYVFTLEPPSRLDAEFALPG
ncbi:hypothetical protein SERLA73DRAFT_174846 [Serpula lacrymans var. lacrymans S7.3]|uniref:Uncharacterized protein n=2 Tax=Serpula lacrymans var. lacrymans TaxID=341189 RepID=F8PIK8_SERL3|nr:uncharacterized protein SERLADRAFT_456526 [Serpula lacrymans var. lacrymans S7.9]EGO03379.1 hypothetical protein SERLA73DRAFT_174846 [Serpula lacrymans var. lacrymans S7.3]EGO29150.1 hypothetical protein SERLADRAFT_456526 [Serpula lacrymans var. lacrymans S7.9]